jgi:hypothetical protein
MTPTPAHHDPVTETGAWTPTSHRPLERLPAPVGTPTELATAARQLAEVHAATRTFLTDGSGSHGAADPASPGPRVWDLAQLAHRLVPLTEADGSGAGPPDLVRQRRRLAALCQAYSMAGDEVPTTPADVLAVVAQRLLALAEDADARLAGGAEHLAGHGDAYRRDAAWVDQHTAQLAQPAPARLVVITGPIASGKTTTAAAVAAAATARGLTAVVLDVDDVAEMVAAPGAAATGLWLSAHQAHGALVARWVRTPVDLVIAVGPIFSPTERAALLEPLPTGTQAHWVVLDAPVATTSARAAVDPTRGLSRDPAFHHERHQRFRRLMTGLPADEVFDTGSTGVEAVAVAVLAALEPGGVSEQQCSTGGTGPSPRRNHHGSTTGRRSSGAGPADAQDRPDR